MRNQLAPRAPERRPGRSPAVPPTSPGPGLIAPVRLLDVDVSEPIGAIEPTGHDGVGPATPSSALVLARIHSQPVGLVELSLRDRGLPADEVAGAIEAAVGASVRAHRAADEAIADSDAAHSVTAARAGEPRPACLVEREGFLASAPAVTVVVPTRDRPDRVVACVESILGTGYPQLTVVVVDNARRSDATERIIRERFSATPVRYVREDRPGSARARNRGLAAATTDIVAFVDDDVLVDPGWAAAIVRPFQEDRSVGCVTGMIVAAELETQAQVWIEEYGGFGKGFERRTFDLDRHRVDHPLYPFAAGMFGSGATMAFRREALRAVGGFDEALGGGTPALGGEDLAAFVEILLAGRSLVYEPAAMVRHFHHREYERLRRVMYGYGTGLSAYLTSIALRHPREVPGMLARALRAAVYVLDPGSPKNARKRPGYPRELARLELLGLMYGPLAYVRGRLAPRRLGGLRSSRHVRAGGDGIELAEGGGTGVAS